MHDLMNITSLSQATVKRLRYALVESRGGREELERHLLNVARVQIDRMLANAEWTNDQEARFAAYVAELKGSK
jgi:hypothetical protein